MDQTFTVNLIWGLIPFFGIIISGAFWLNNRRNRIVNASIHPRDLAKEVQTISTDEILISEADPDRYQPIVINETEGDDDAEPSYIGWFY